MKNNYYELYPKEKINESVTQAFLKVLDSIKEHLGKIKEQVNQITKF